MPVSVVVLIGKCSGATNAGIWGLEGPAIVFIVWHRLINSSWVDLAILYPFFSRRILRRPQLSSRATRFAWIPRLDDRSGE
jgi:hypothetical protein